MFRLTAGCVLVLVLGACVSAGGANAQANSARLTEARAACGQLGLNSTEQPYDDCVTSLLQSANARATSVAVAGAREQCVQMGLQRGTPDFANCVLDRANTMTP